MRPVMASFFRPPPSALRNADPVGALQPLRMLEGVPPLHARTDPYNIVLGSIHWHDVDASHVSDHHAVLCSKAVDATP